MAQMHSTVIRLTPDTVLPEKDIRRALRVAQAAAVGDCSKGKYLKALGSIVEPESLFVEGYSSLVSSDPMQARYVICRAIDNTIFIGFRSTKDFSDVACDLNFCFEESKPGSSFHRGFSARCCDFYGKRESNLLDKILHRYQSRHGQPQRVILCGHSLGGAVAQLVLARWLDDNQVKLDQLSPLSMIAITFGAPHVCDKVTADVINHKLQGTQRIISIVNQTDPISRILHQMPNSSGYSPIGLLVFLEQSGKNPRVRQVKSTNSGEIDELLRRNMFQLFSSSLNGRQHHKLASYEETLVETGVINRPQHSLRLDPSEFSKRPGKPEVHKVIYCGVQGDGKYHFEFLGKNLEDTRKMEMTWNGVKVSGEFIPVSETELRLSTSKKCWQRATGKVDVVYITVKTHSGECSEIFESTKHRLFRRLRIFAKRTTQAAVVASAVGTTMVVGTVAAVVLLL